MSTEVIKSGSSEATSIGAKVCPECRSSNVLTKVLASDEDYFVEEEAIGPGVGGHCQDCGCVYVVRED